MSQSIYQQHKPGNSDDLYLRLRDGDKVKLRIVSEPAITVFKQGDRPRYNWVVFNRDKNKPQVYQSGVSVYSQIGDLVEDWGSPEGFDITIKRTGSGMNDTEYSVVPVKESIDLTKAQLEEANKIDLLQACKGKWLRDFVDDGVLPAPLQEGVVITGQDEVVEDDGEPIDLSTIPF